MIALILLNACGGTATPAPTASNPTPTAPTTPSTPPSTPTPGTTTSGSPTQYQVTLIGADFSTHGQLSVDTAGDVHVTLTKAAPGTYNVTFASWNNGGWTTPAMTLGTLLADSGGNATGTFHFPKSGIWVGDFGVSNSSTGYFVNWGGGAAETMNLTLLPAKGDNGGLGSQNVIASAPQDPLSSGSVTVSGGRVHLTVTGAAPNVTYIIALCGHQCQEQGRMNTDASGNGSIDMPEDTIAVDGDIFELTRIGPDNAFGNIWGFSSGFKIP